MRVEIRRTGDAACGAAADFLALRIQAATDARGVAAIALSGGATPPRMFEEVAKADLPWRQIHVFQVDERLAPDGHPDRNVTGLRDHLVARVALPATNFHPIPVDEPNLADAAERYGRALATVCGNQPVLDVVHLGLGTDGHTGSLVPGDAVSDVEDADVGVTQEYEGRVRLTLTYPVLRRARELFWLVVGGAKAEALAGLLAGQILPATRLRRDDAVVFTDEEAAGRAGW